MAYYVGGALTPSIKIAVIRKRCPVDLRRHLQLAAADIQGDYNRLHEVVESYFRARGSVPGAPAAAMELDYISAALKGKGQVKGQGKGKSFVSSGKGTGANSSGKGTGASSSGMTCYTCGGFGHRSRDCPTGATKISSTSKAQPQAQQQPQQKKRFPPGDKIGKACHNCGKLGHFAAECRGPKATKSLHELGVEPEPRRPSS
jgi:hypothetical protein